MKEEGKDGVFATARVLTDSERTVGMKERRAKNRRTMLFCLWGRAGLISFSKRERAGLIGVLEYGRARMPIMENGAGFGVGAQCPVPEGGGQPGARSQGALAEEVQTISSTLAMLPGRAKQGIQGHHA